MVSRGETSTVKSNGTDDGSAVVTVAVIGGGQRGNVSFGVQ